MKQVVHSAMAVLVICTLLPSAVCAQDKHPATTVTIPESSFSTDITNSLPPLENPATKDQIQEFLRLSGEENSFRQSWIAAVDKNRSDGAPYWPESFWTAVKEEMQKTDLTPMYVILSQHYISKELMQEVLDAYHRLGAEHFHGSQECIKLGNAVVAMNSDMDKVKLAMTRKVVLKVYAIYKPQIKAARVQYMAEHPGWSDK
jgi:hypothetical protein